MARYQVDGERWPRLARLLADAFALPAFQHLACFEKATAQTPVAEQRQALREAGFNFVGPTICYAFMQASGMVMDHTQDCDRYAQLVG